MRHENVTPLGMILSALLYLTESTERVVSWWKGVCRFEVRLPLALQLKHVIQLESSLLFASEKQVRFRSHIDNACKLTLKTSASSSKINNPSPPVKTGTI
jgi:hypothetical protein